VTYFIEDHTADIRVRITSKTILEVFYDALDMLSDIMRPHDPDESSGTSRQVKISAVDSTSVLIDFLNEVLFLAQAHNEVYSNMKLAVLSETSLVCSLKGVKVQSFGRCVKAVTYHDAQLKRKTNGDWQVTLVLDV